MINIEKKNSGCTITPPKFSRENISTLDKTNSEFYLNGFNPELPESISEKGYAAGIIHAAFIMNN
jgi:hypothetical protein